MLANILPRQSVSSAMLGAMVGLLLIRPEARLLHAQVGPRARRGQSPSDDPLETIGRPRVRQRFIRRNCQDLTVDSAPVCAKIETVVHDRLEVVLHEPLLDQVWLRERTPNLLRRIRYLTFDNDVLPEAGHLACPVDQRANRLIAFSFRLACPDVSQGKEPCRFY